MKVEETNPEELKIRHEPKAKRFAARLGNKIAYLSYEVAGDTVLDYAHTWTPPEERGKGIAGRITRQALEYAKSEGYKVVPSCPYVRDYIKAHPEYEELVR